MVEVVVCIVCHDKKILLVRRKSGEKDLTWVFPGGTVEPGETELQTAIRELKEETNIDSEPIELIGDRIHPYTKKHMAYVAMKPLSFDLKLGDDDLDDIRWVDVSELEEYFDTPLYGAVKEYLEKVRS